MPVVTHHPAARTPTGCAPRRAGRSRTAACGSPPPTARRSQPGEVGEVLVQGPTVMPEYWRNPEATARGVPRGRLAAHRRRGVPRRRGHAVDRRPHQGRHHRRQLQRVPGRRRVGARGLPADRRGRRGRAPRRRARRGAGRVRRAAGARRDERRRRQGACSRDGSRRYKHPQDVVFVDALPRNAMGKVDGDRLRESLAGGAP